MSIFSGSKSATPSSILKRTPNLRTALNQSLKTTPTKVRFVLPHSKKVRTILRDFIRKNQVKEYESLVCLIRDSDLLDTDVSALLREATECISLLKHEVRLFIEALLMIDWVNRDESVIKEYKLFIVNLIAAHNYHAELVIGRLVGLFLPNPADPEWPGGTPSQHDYKKCNTIHGLLNEILVIIPLCKDILTQEIVSHFPYMTKSAHAHESYIQNLLWITFYQPDLRGQIFHLIFSKLIIMDVNAPRQEIEKLQNEEEIFEMEITPNQIQSISHTMDVCMEKVLNYLYAECHEQGSTELNWLKTKSLYQDMLTIFDKVILPTYNSHHIQFVMLFICSFKPTLTEGFVNYLWKKTCNPNVPTVIRQSSVNYIVSLMARANFVSLAMLKGTLQQIAEWINCYIIEQDGLESINSDLRVHSVFYTVCQALFYIISFRHKDLVTQKKNMVFLESLNLAKIVTSRLNPLRVCQPAVVQNFAAITRKYQLAYCYSIIEHNSRNTLQTMYRDDRGFVTLTSSVLDAVYPFDPYLLERSGKKIHPYYRPYQEINVEVEDIEMRDVTDADDFLEHELHPRPQKFSYGTSPGFKVKC